MDYMIPTDFGVDSSSLSPFRARQSDRQSYPQINSHTRMQLNTTQTAGYCCMGHRQFIENCETSHGPL